MIAESAIQITIEYKLIDRSYWNSIDLTTNEYFDLEPNEKVELDSITRYNHAIEYLPVEPHQVLVTKIVLIDEAVKAKRSIVERFWNNGKNRVIERTDLGVNAYWETILEIQVSEDPPLWEIIRLGRKEGVMTPWYHAFLQDNDDGSQTETRVDTEATTELKQGDRLPAVQK